MERSAEKAARKANRKRRRGPKKPTVPVEKRVITVEGLPARSRFKGYELFTIQDLVIQPRVVCYHRERWLTPDGRTMVASLPAGVDDHFGPEIKRFILAQYHQGQTTVPRLVELLRMIGVDISERQVVRILTGGNAAFVAEAQDVLRAGLGHGTWISVDDTGARHQGKNGVCTQIGNAAFTFFATTFSKSRANFLGLLRAGYCDYALNDEAFNTMRQRGLADGVTATLAGHPARRFADTAAWEAHLDALNIGKPGRRAIATEGALWGAIQAHGFLNGAVVLSDDAGQFDIGIHALCWVHAERLVHKLTVFSAEAIKAKEVVRQLIWWFYADLKAYAAAPTARRKAMMKARFDRIFRRQTGFELIDSLLARLLANKDELLRVLDYPDIPLHTNGSENDVRCQVTRRKISGTTRSDNGRDCRDAFLGLAKTCGKLGISFWDYLGSRLGALVTNIIPPLPDLVAAHCCAVSVRGRLS
ncbi:conserved hypothetical protein [Candidatus Terasakiella magnetica]|nr:conserved hypothetical protein [Candidatus Terasakiella magnetica]